MQVPAISDPTVPGEAERQFDEIRPKLLGIAYRIVGGVAEAEEVVQEVRLRWQDAGHLAIPFPAAFLTSVTTRLSFKYMLSHRLRRDKYIGPWLAEPTEAGRNARRGPAWEDDLSFAVLCVMERMKPKERAAYVLRDILDYSDADVAAALRIGEADVRCLVAQARVLLRAEQRAPIAVGSVGIHAGAARLGDEATRPWISAP